MHNAIYTRVHIYIYIIRSAVYYCTYNTECLCSWDGMLPCVTFTTRAEPQTVFCIFLTPSSEKNHELKEFKYCCIVARLKHRATGAQEGAHLYILILSGVGVVYLLCTFGKGYIYIYISVCGGQEIPRTDRAVCRWFTPSIPSHPTSVLSVCLPQLLLPVPSLYE